MSSIGTRISNSIFKYPSILGIFCLAPLTVDSNVFRRNYVFLSTVFVGAFAFEIAFDTTTDAIWNSWNKGRQWKDIKQRYLTSAEEEE